MKEFNNSFTIQFKIDPGITITHKVEVKEIERGGEPYSVWFYFFEVGGNLATLWGNMDKDMDIRTDGDLGNGRMSSFWIDIQDKETKAYIHEVNDIDIIDCE